MKQHNNNIYILKISRLRRAIIKQSKSKVSNHHHWLIHDQLLDEAAQQQHLHTKISRLHRAIIKQSKAKQPITG
jgi:hypothetical protein